MTGLVSKMAKKPRKPARKFPAAMTLRDFNQAFMKHDEGMDEERKNVEPEAVLIGPAYKGKRVTLVPQDGFSY